MQPLTQRAYQELSTIAQRYGVSNEAALSMLESLLRGGGAMAQFNHPELGGYGQWMRGGMTMVGDMFNNGLKATVDGLCSELSRLLESQPFEQAPASTQNSGVGALAWAPLPGSWWPAELGHPSSSGSQNDMRYAYFPGPRRLAIEQNGQVTVYDTLNHDIGGVSQQQGSGYSLAFTSQLGRVSLEQLPVVSPNAPGFAAQTPTPPSFDTAGIAARESEQDVFAKIERLAELRQKGVLTDDEFSAKKAELLSRI